MMNKLLILLLADNTFQERSPQYCVKRGIKTIELTVIIFNSTTLNILYTNKNLSTYIWDTQKNTWCKQHN